MSLSIPTPKTTWQGMDRKQILLSVIQFQHPVKWDLKKNNFLTFKLQTNPTQDMPPTYDLSVPFFSCGTAKELFDLIKNIQCICRGQILMDGPGAMHIMHLLQGDMLTAFNHGATTYGNKTIQNFKLVLQDLIMCLLSIGLCVVSYTNCLRSLYRTSWHDWWR